MKMNRKICLLILLLVCQPAYAYLDAGSGSVLIQILLAGVGGMLAIIKLYWQRMKEAYHRVIAKLQKKPKPRSKLEPTEQSADKS